MFHLIARLIAVTGFIIGAILRQLIAEVHLTDGTSARHRARSHQRSPGGTLRAVRLIAWTVSAVTLAGLLASCSGGKKNASVAVGSPSSSSSPAATPPEPIASSAAPSGPITFKVLAGHSEGAFDIEMYMPAEIRIRQGDTIEWTAQGFEGHTITFATPGQLQTILQNYLLDDPKDAQQKIFNPDAAYRSLTSETFAGDGTYVNSGFIGVPAEAKYRLTFAKQGTYEYLCLVHPFTMRGTVTVDAPDGKVDSPETVAARVSGRGWGDDPPRRRRADDSLRAKLRRTFIQRWI